MTEKEKDKEGAKKSTEDGGREDEAKKSTEDGGREDVASASVSSESKDADAGTQPGSLDDGSDSQEPVLRHRNVASDDTDTITVSATPKELKRIPSDQRLFNYVVDEEAAPRHSPTLWLVVVLCALIAIFAGLYSWRCAGVDYNEPSIARTLCEGISLSLPGSMQQFLHPWVWLHPLHFSAMRWQRLGDHDGAPEGRTWPVARFGQTAALCDEAGDCAGPGDGSAWFISHGYFYDMDANKATYLQDTWVFDFQQHQWREMTPALSPSPSDTQIVGHPVCSIPMFRDYLSSELGLSVPASMHGADKAILGHFSPSFAAAMAERCAWVHFSKSVVATGRMGASLQFKAGRSSASHTLLLYGGDTGSVCHRARIAGGASGGGEPTFLCDGATAGQRDLAQGSGSYVQSAWSDLWQFNIDRRVWVPLPVMPSRELHTVCGEECSMNDVAAGHSFLTPAFLTDLCAVLSVSDVPACQRRWLQHLSAPFTPGHMQFGRAIARRGLRDNLLVVSWKALKAIKGLKLKDFDLSQRSSLSLGAGVQVNELPADVARILVVHTLNSTSLTRRRIIPAAVPSLTYHQSQLMNGGNELLLTQGLSYYRVVCVRRSKSNGVRVYTSESLLVGTNGVWSVRLDDNTGGPLAITSDAVPVPRIAAASTKLSSNCMLLFGGKMLGERLVSKRIKAEAGTLSQWLSVWPHSDSGSLNDLWTLCTHDSGAAWQHVEVPDGPQHRMYSAMVMRASGRVFVIGGALCNPGCTCFNDVWSIDLAMADSGADATWSAVGPWSLVQDHSPARPIISWFANRMPVPRYKHSVALVQTQKCGGKVCPSQEDGDLVLFGGELYQPHMYLSDMWVGSDGQ